MSRLIMCCILYVRHPICLPKIYIITVVIVLLYNIICMYVMYLAKISSAYMYTVLLIENK